MYNPRGMIQLSNRTMDVGHGKAQFHTWPRLIMYVKKSKKQLDSFSFACRSGDHIDVDIHNPVQELPGLMVFDVAARTWEALEALQDCEAIVDAHFALGVRVPVSSCGSSPMPEKKSKKKRIPKRGRVVDGEIARWVEERDGMLKDHETQR